MTTCVTSTAVDTIDWRGWAEAIDVGEARVEVLKGKCGSALVARVQVEPTTSTIVKIWQRRGLRGGLRGLTRTDKASREWRVLHRLAGIGVRVPRPLAFCRLKRPQGHRADVVFMEDIGHCETAMRHLKKIVAQGDDVSLDRYEADIIASARCLIMHGIIDTDCILQNFLIAADGRLVRNDFEMTRVVICPVLWPRAYGDMIGRLVASFAFATQPYTDKAMRFADNLAQSLSPPRRVLAHAKLTAEWHLQKQLEDGGMDTRLVLNW